jgi:hypothetical protein
VHLSSMGDSALKRFDVVQNRYIRGNRVESRSRRLKIMARADSVLLCRCETQLDAGRWSSIIALLDVAMRSVNRRAIRSGRFVLERYAI